MEDWGCPQVGQIRFEYNLSSNLCESVLRIIDLLSIQLVVKSGGFRWLDYRIGYSRIGRTNHHWHPAAISPNLVEISPD